MDATSAARVEARFVEEEHRRLRAGLASLDETIAEAHHLTRAELAERVLRALDWLRRDVLPHANWEDAWLFPELDRVAGTPWATRLLRFEHAQIVEVTKQLEDDALLLHEHWSNAIAMQVVARLARLAGLVTAHVSQEERFALPLIERDRAGS